MAREGLRLVLGEARERGAEEGRVEAAALAGNARHPLVRSRRGPGGDDEHPEFTRALAAMRAFAEMDDRFPEED